MVNEFHTIDGLCGSFVPSGPLYASFPDSNKACTTVGSQPGNPYVNGNRFVFLSFGYLYSHLWRVGCSSFFPSPTDHIPYQNFGIVLAFSIFFMILLLIFTEFNTSLAGVTSVMLFKRGSGASQVQGVTSRGSGSDEEKTKVPSSATSELDAPKENKEAIHEAMEHQPKMQNTFTWQHVNYEVAGRRLLNDVTGYVAPGKLTALMGESGAGKVCACDGTCRSLELTFPFQRRLC